MNNVVLIGRLTRDPEVRYTNGTNGQMAIAKYGLAVDRRFNRAEQTADFFNITAFGKQGEFVDRYLHKGMKIAISGHIQTGSYINRDGQKVNTVEIIAENHEFCESKNANSDSQNSYTENKSTPQDRNFVNVPDDVEEELPFL